MRDLHVPLLQEGAFSPGHQGSLRHEQSHAPEVCAVTSSFLECVWQLLVTVLL